MPTTSTRNWTLSEYGEGLSQRRTISIQLPNCLVGRGSECGLTIVESSVSKIHSRLFEENGQLYVEDLGSTNGTFVNGKQVSHSAIVAGDLVQFANALYRADCDTPSESHSSGTIVQGVSPWAKTLMVFGRLIDERAVVPNFQPIVNINDRSTPAYELLARSDIPELRNPAAMFGAAERLGQQVVLSEIMRHEGCKVASENEYKNSSFFLNTHAEEVGTDRLIESLFELRRSFPDLPVVIEIHESAVTKIDEIRQLRDVLTSLDMKLSYDDFGAGQGRLLELGEVPPDVLKFDMSLIRDIDSASATRQELLQSLVRVATNLGTTTLAEGIETEAEHLVCQQMGFELVQGFYYGRPDRVIAPIEVEITEVV